MTSTSRARRPGVRAREAHTVAAARVLLVGPWRPPAGAYDPWARLGWEHPAARVVLHKPGVDMLGAVLSFDPVVIALDPDLGPAQARCTLAHELVHLRREPVPIDLAARGAEEATVEQLAARDLVPLELPAGVLHLRHLRQAAAVLQVDRSILQVRLAELDARERWSLAGSVSERPGWAV